MVAIGLAVSVGQPSVAAHVHANRQVEPLDVARGNLFEVRIAEAWDDLYAGYLRWAVAGFNLACRVGLD
jgi:hypothetical protein